MKKRKNMKWYLAYGGPAVVLFLLMVAGVFLPEVSNLFETRDPIDFTAFGETAAPTAVPDAAAKDDLAVWVNTSPSMAGFIKIGSSDRVPFVYRHLLENLDTVVKAYSPNAVPMYYWFDSQYSLAETADDTNRANARTTHEAAENTWLTDGRNYSAKADAITKGGSSSALPSVLNTLELDKPALILTDFEADGLKLPAKEYQIPLSRIYSRGLCVSVVAMKGAYSGILYNYLNDGVDYAYGTKDNKAQQLITSNIYQYRARPFYAVIVGTGRQCAALSEQLAAAYNDFCGKRIVAPFPNLTHADMRAEDFVACKTANYRLNEQYTPVTAVDGKAASVAASAGMTRVAEAATTPAADGRTGSDTDTISDGIPRYLIEKRSDLKTATLTLLISPPSESYADTHASDLFTVEQIGLSMIEQTQVDTGKTAELTPTATLYDRPGILLARGSRYVKLTEKDIEPTEAACGWFTCPKIRGEANGVTLTLQVNAAEAAAGLYRVELPVCCKHATDVVGQGDEAWIGEWTVKQSNLSGNGKSQNTAARTANLQQQLEQFRIQNVKQSGQEPVQIAMLTVFLEIR